ncbi:MAG: agmatine deiminase family protein, partial [Phycisphaerae bacterium]|nr:agmatine deiminase family protein [Phycisphaerae bacterium]
FNAFLGPLWGEIVYDIPLEHGGGNFHLFSNGDAFMTDLVLDENPGLTEQNVKDLYSDYQNVNLTIYPGFPTSFDATQHIDMWMLPVGDNKVIIGQYASSTGQPYTITENAAADLVARGYTVYRTPGWNSSGTHYTYTNAVIINDLVFVPKFGVSQDATALAVFQAAMPGHTTIQVDCSGIITAAGAMHCIVMHVPAYLTPEPVVRLLSPNGGEIWNPGQPYDITWTARDDVAVTAVDLYYSTDGGLTYPNLIAAGLPDTGSFIWTAPSIVAHHCRVRAIAHDADAHTGQDESDADFRIAPGGPQVVYAWDMNTNPGWTTEGLWAYGKPTGNVGSDAYGGPDPAAGHTGTQVYAYNLNGDYEANLAERHLTTTAIDCTGLANVELRFWRWLGVERPLYDHAYIRAQGGTGTWQTIWQNDATIDDNAWVSVAYDISAIADDEPELYLRWTMGTADGSWQYCGWNIDDVEIWAAAPAEGDGDCDSDGNVDLADFAAFQQCFSGPDAEWIPAACAPVDLDADADVDHEDVALFTALLTGP